MKIPPEIKEEKIHDYSIKSSSKEKINDKKINIKENTLEDKNLSQEQYPIEKNPQKKPQKLNINSEKDKYICEKMDKIIGINLEMIDMAFCTLYDNDYSLLIEQTLNTLKSNNIKGYLNFKIGLKIFNQRKPIFKKVENLQKELYQNYNFIIK
jgi:hypothetical protein